MQIQFIVRLLIYRSETVCRVNIFRSTFPVIQVVCIGSFKWNANSLTKFEFLVMEKFKCKTRTQQQITTKNNERIKLITFAATLVMAPNAAGKKKHLIKIVHSNKSLKKTY